MDKAWLVAFPSNFVRVKNLLKKWKLWLPSRVEIMDSAGPEGFYRAFKSASWVLSDSFHALMFAICNGCDARIIRPTSQKRQRMFTRIKEFASHAKGSLVVDSISSALDSFARGEKIAFDYGWISSRCEDSEKWLLDNLK